MRQKLDLKEVLWARETQQYPLGTSYMIPIVYRDVDSSLVSTKPLDTKPPLGRCYIATTEINMSYNVVIVIAENLFLRVSCNFSCLDNSTTKFRRHWLQESLPSSTPDLKIPFDNQPLRIRISKHWFVNTHRNRNKLESLWIHLHETIWIPPTSYFHWIVPPWGFHVHRISLGRGW